MVITCYTNSLTVHFGPKFEKPKCRVDPSSSLELSSLVLRIGPDSAGWMSRDTKGPVWKAQTLKELECNRAICQKPRKTAIVNGTVRNQGTLQLDGTHLQYREASLGSVPFS